MTLLFDRFSFSAVILLSSRRLKNSFVLVLVKVFVNSVHFSVSSRELGLVIIVLVSDFLRYCVF
jgi:hypothetical protein